MNNKQIFTKPRYRISIHSSSGGRSHVDYLLVIAARLHELGHSISYIAPDENKAYIKEYNYIQFYSLGSLQKELMDSLAFEEEAFYESNSNNLVKMYQLLSHIFPLEYKIIHKFYKAVENVQPHVLICDFMSQSCRDVANKLGITLINSFQHADVYGLEDSVLTNSFGINKMYKSELNMFEYLHETVYLKYLELYYQINLYFRLTKIRNKYDIDPNKFPLGSFDSNLAIANTFIGYEPSLPVKPNFHMVGPILNYDRETFVSEEVASFLHYKKKIVYIAFGNNMIPPKQSLSILLQGLSYLIESEVIDGIILGLGKRIPLSTIKTITSINNSSLLAIPSAPQRYILNHSSTKLFVTHAGLTSSFESIQSSTPLLTLPLLADQYRSSQKLGSQNVALALDYKKMTIEDVIYKSKKLIEDKGGMYKKNLALLKAKSELNDKINGGNVEYAVRLILAEIEMSEICKSLDNTSCKQRHQSYSNKASFEIYWPLFTFVAIILGLYYLKWNFKRNTYYQKAYSK